MRLNIATRTASILICIGVCACSPPRPDLTRLYSFQTQADQQPPVIVIHGALGGRLSDSALPREVWPGPLRRLLFSDYESLELPIDPQTLEPAASDLSVSGITDKAAGKDFYGRILRVLEEAGGYEPGVLGQPVRDGQKRYYIFSYDWRQDNVRTVKVLDQFIEQIRADYGQPDLKVDIVAHSMGGSITRYYVRYGIQDVLDTNEFPATNYGGERIRRVILLGTPNLGSAKAIISLAKGFKIGFGAIPVEVVATFPSTYQLLPHPISVWLVNQDGEQMKRDLFDVDFWRNLEFGVFDPAIRERVVSRRGSREGAAYLAVLERYFAKHLERGRRFVWSLTVPVPESRVRYVVFGGDCYLTPARVLIEEDQGSPHLRLYPDEVRNRRPGIDYEGLMLEPGDGVVTKASLLARQALDPTVERHEFSFFPMNYAFFLCEKHDALTSNINFQDNLLHNLLSVDLE